MPERRRNRGMVAKDRQSEERDEKIRMERVTKKKKGNGGMCKVRFTETQRKRMDG